MTSSSREKAEVLDSVADYLKAQGFEPESIMVGTRNGREILIVSKVLREFTQALLEDTDMTASSTAGESAATDLAMLTPGFLELSRALAGASQR